MENELPEGFENQEGATFWNPVLKGDKVEGKIVNITDAQYGKQYTIRKENGEEIVTPSHKVLQSRMIKADFDDEVCIIYKDELPPQVRGQKPTKLYIVGIKKHSSPV